MVYLAAVIFWIAPKIGVGAELKKETIEAFDNHVTGVEKRLAPRFTGQDFLWTDRSAQRRQKVKQGAVVVEPVQDKGVIPAKGGLIHDWTGAAFIPGVTLAQTLHVVQDYNRHKEIYPEVADSQVRSHHGDDFSVYMRIVRSKFFLTDVLNTDQDVHFVTLDATRVFSRAYSKRITEISNPGPHEHELPVGNDRGLLWRLNVYWFFEERENGVYIECEAITLTRDVPYGTGKLFAPIVQSVPGESLRTTLEQTRKAVLDRNKH